MWLKVERTSQPRAGGFGGELSFQARFAATHLIVLHYFGPKDDTVDKMRAKNRAG